jgi:hypothetical protein
MVLGARIDSCGRFALATSYIPGQGDIVAQGQLALDGATVILVTSQNLTDPPAGEGEFWEMIFNEDNQTANVLEGAFSRLGETFGELITVAAGLLD